MSRKTYPTMILFGVKGHKKCLVGYHNKMLGGISVAICEYAGAEEDDAKIDLADIEGQWSTLHFCNKEALDKFVHFFENVQEKWDVLSKDTPTEKKPEVQKKQHKPYLDCVAELEKIAERNTEEGKEVSQIVKEKFQDIDTVYVEYDVSPTDKYGRTLAYVYFEDGTMVQDWLLENGYANTATYPPNVKHADHFAELAHTAAEQKVGLWNGFFEEQN